MERAGSGNPRTRGAVCGRSRCPTIASALHRCSVVAFHPPTVATVPQHISFIYSFRRLTVSAPTTLLCSRARAVSRSAHGHAHGPHILADTRVYRSTTLGSTQDRKGVCTLARLAQGQLSCDTPVACACIYPPYTRSMPRRACIYTHHARLCCTYHTHRAPCAAPASQGRSRIVVPAPTLYSMRVRCCTVCCAAAAPVRHTIARPELSCERSAGGQRERCSTRSSCHAACLFRSP